MTDRRGRFLRWLEHSFIFPSSSLSGGQAEGKAQLPRPCLRSLSAARAAAKPFRAIPDSGSGASGVRGHRPCRGCGDGGADSKAPPRSTGALDHDRSASRNRERESSGRRNCDLVLLDCLTIWLSNFCWEHREFAEADLQAAALLELKRVAEASQTSNVVLVTNEVGCGLVPESPVGRGFRDLQGWVNQEAARAADWVYHLVAGIPIAIKRPEERR